MEFYQPQPVKVVFEGDPRDVDYYLRRFKSVVENSTYDNVQRTGPNTVTIHPRAVND